MAKFRQTTQGKINANIMIYPIRFKIILGISLLTNILLIGYIYAS